MVLPLLVQSARPANAQPVSVCASRLDWSSQLSALVVPALFVVAGLLAGLMPVLRQSTVRSDVDVLLCGECVRVCGARGVVISTIGATMSQITITAQTRLPTRLSSDRRPRRPAIDRPESPSTPRCALLSVASLVVFTAEGREGVHVGLALEQQPRSQLPLGLSYLLLPHRRLSPWRRVHPCYSHSSRQLLQRSPRPPKEREGTWPWPWQL